jgi:threonine dehydrogenase-like Zn-dependent dehydrogenase
MDERDRRRRLAHAMMAKERAAASSEGEVAASVAAAEGDEGGELAVDASGAVAEGQHDGGSENQQQKQARPTLTLTP